MSELRREVSGLMKMANEPMNGVSGLMKTVSELTRNVSR
jgi:hypothetical protein